MLTSVLLLVAMGQLGPGAVVRSDITLEPIISYAKYCREPQGDITLRLGFLLTYQNTSQKVIVLPIFTVQSGYDLFAHEAALKLNRSETSVSLPGRDVLDPAKLDPSAPDRKFFWILHPGETASAYESLWITVKPAKEKGVSLLGKTRYVRLRMNPWRADRKVGERLQKSWEPYGVLWMTEIEWLPLKFHVHYSPDAQVCRGHYWPADELLK